MKHRHKLLSTLLAVAMGGAMASGAVQAMAQAKKQQPARVQAQPPAQAQPQKRPNIVMLMTDDTGWNDFGAYSNGGAALGHPTANVDQIAKEGAVFTATRAARRPAPRS